jgi:hypothetical protein
LEALGRKLKWPISAHSADILTYCEKPTKLFSQNEEGGEEAKKKKKKKFRGTKF